MEVCVQIDIYNARVCVCELVMTVRVSRYLQRVACVCVWIDIYNARVCAHELIFTECVCVCVARWCQGARSLVFEELAD